MTTIVQEFWGRVFDTATNHRNSVPVRYPGCKEIFQVSWAQAGTAVASIMSFLKENGVKEGDRIAVLGWSTAQVLWADLAIQSLKAVTVLVATSKAANGLNSILEKARVTISLSIEPDQLKMVQTGLAFNLDEEVPLSTPRPHMPALSAQIPEHSATTGIVPEKVLAELQACRHLDIPNPDILASLVFTSGSSGQPKGCMHTQRSLAAASSAISQVGLDMGASDLYLCYLSLSHIFARVNAYVCIRLGIPIAFSTVEKMREDVRIFKPSLLDGVPMVWEKLRNGVLDPKEGRLPMLLNRIPLSFKLERKEDTKFGFRLRIALTLWKFILDFAVSRKEGTFLHSLFSKYIFQEIRQKLGGKLKVCVSGGAAIAPKVLRFLQMVIDADVLEGYGTSETCSAVCVGRPRRAKTPGPKSKLGSVGLPLDGVHVRIVPPPLEPGDEALPDGVGEIQVAGDQVFAGYYELPEVTAEVFTPDGYYRTSDLGYFDKDGFLYILERIDGMYKTSYGMYVPRGKLQASLKPYPIVHVSIPEAKGRKFPLTLIFLDEVKARALAGDPPAGVDLFSFLAANSAVQSAVAQAIQGANKSLESHMQMKYALIMPLRASTDPETGVLTDTLKPRDKVVLKRYKALLDEFYAKIERGGSNPQVQVARLS